MISANQLLAASYTASNPAQVSALLPSLRPGDTVVLSSGTWNNADLLLKGNGTSQQPITFRAATPGQVLLTGSSRLRIAGSHLTIDGLVFQQGYRTSGEVIAFRESTSSVAVNCRLSNCAIIDYNPPAGTNETKWISLYGVSNRIDHCYFKGKNDLGSLIVVWVSTTPNYHRIDHNHFGARPPLAENGGEIIRVGNSSSSLHASRTLVESNYFQQCNGDVEFISNKSCENTYRGNTFVDCEGALTLRLGHRCVVEGNAFYGHNKSRTGGVRIIGEDHKVYNNYFADLAGTSARAALSIMQGLTNSPADGYFQVKNAVVAFNTFVNCERSIIIGLADTYTGTTNLTTLPVENSAIANNIVRTTRNQLVEQRNAPVNMRWEGNIMHGTTLGILANSGIRVIDPQLIQGADSIWRPNSSSPALAAARGSYPFVAMDFDLQQRPSAKDAGCDQWSAAPPSASLEAGPSWMSSQPRLSISKSGARFTLQWNAVPGSSYQIQYSDDLQTWNDVSSTLVATSALQSWTDDGSQAPPSGTGRRFYRLRPS